MTGPLPLRAALTRSIAEGGGPELHIVPAGQGGSDARATKALDPERRLRTLFRAEASLERKLLEVRRDIGVERKRYAEKHKLGFFPPLERLRRLFA